MTKKATVFRNTATVSVWNDGKGIPVELHPEEAVYVPTMIFGTLFTSSNYDDKETRVVGKMLAYKIP